MRVGGTESKMTDKAVPKQTEKSDASSLMLMQLQSPFWNLFDPKADANDDRAMFVFFLST